MYEADKYVLFGGSKTFWIRNRRWQPVKFFKDYNQPWHVLPPKNYTLRLRGPNNQYFFWVKRR